MRPARLCVAATLLATISMSSADDPITAGAVHLYHPLGAGFQAQTQTSGGYCYYNITNDYRMIFKYEEAEPNTPTFTVTTQGSYAILKAISNNSGVTPNKRCCRWVIGPVVPNREIHSNGNYCVEGTGACQDALLECTGGWVNCPAGWGDPNVTIMINYP